MVTTIRKYTGGAHPFLEFACLSTDTKPVSLVPDNSICHEIDTGKRYYFANKAWHEAPARGGSGDGEGGSSLPENFPTEGAENANKFAGFDENGLWTAKDAPSGGGAEKFVVTLTQEDDTWTADKTVAEIVAADAANQVVVAQLNFDGEIVSGGAPVEIPLSIALAVDDSGIVSFGGVFNLAGTEKAVSAFGFLQSGETSWQVGVTQLGSSNAPLLVTLTAGATEGQFVGDKTYKEVFDAFVAGTNCIAHYTSDDGEGVISCTDANHAGTVYEINFGSSITATGSANDYITISMGG